ncbi:MAG TPA: SURF1 family protein [Steroidobacteraceae bacterium]|nr:SURF1 family protein [Steroidobacteraceae bacterium]
MPIRIGSRVFEPRAFTTLLTLLLVIALVLLGRWQLRRADEKRALYDLFDSGADATRLVDAATPRLPRYQHIEARGAYDPAHQILIDNMSNLQEQAGYYVITPFELQGGGWLLVNRGWVAPGASRADKPQVPVSARVRTLRGRADELPRAGILLGTPAPLAPPYPVVASFPTRAEIGALLHQSAWAKAADVVLLDPGEPDGYLRQWQPPGFPPMRHVAYAVQWFALALALGVIYVVTNLRRTEGT